MYVIALLSRHVVGFDKSLLSNKCYDLSANLAEGMLLSVELKLLTGSA